MKNAKSLFLILLAGMTLSSCQLLNGPSQSSEVPSSSESNPGTSSSSTIEDLKTPVYEGMSIAAPSDEGNTGPLNRPKRKGNDHDQGWHNGWGNRDHDDEIEDDIETLTDIEIYESSETEYFIQPGELFIIEVHLSNPYDFEIQSFTLNGNKYSSYMFERGSTMELLRLEVRAPGEPGLKEYTIDAIKYIDGTEIKDVRMSGEKTIKAGFTYLDAPSASVSTNVTTTSISFDIELSDPWSRIQPGTTKFFLTDGKTIITQQALELGHNSISATDLFMSTAYQYGISTAFDLLDGNGFHSAWLAQDIIYTDSAVSITIDEVGDTSITFSAEIDNSCSVGDVTYTLYDEVSGQGKNMLETGTFSELLSDHDYTIYVDYIYALKGEMVTDWTRTEVIHTGSKTAPTYSFDSLTADKTGVSYSVASNDPSHIGSLDAVKVYDGETLVNESQEASGAFSNLLSNHSYSIVAEYSYDLNDGAGIRKGTTSGTFLTLAKSAPSLLLNATVTGTSLSYVLVINDPDQIAVVESVSVYKVGEETPFLTQEGQSIGVFSGLLTNADYYVLAKISYDLNDGSPALSAEADYSFHIDAKYAPTIYVHSLTSDKETINYELEITDPSETLVEYRAELIDDGKVVQSISNKDKEAFNNVLSGHQYSFHVAYSYDLGDGMGAQNREINDSIETLAKQAPTVAVGSLVREGNDIKYSFTAEDPDNILVLKKVRLVAESETIAESTSCTGGTFQNAPDDVALSVAFDYSYDLNDGQGEIEKTLTTLVPLNAFYYDEDGTTLLGSDIFQPGTEPSFKGETPKKANNEEAGLQYSFSHWEAIETKASQIKFVPVYDSCTIGLVMQGNSVESFEGDATEIVIPSHWDGNEIVYIANDVFKNCPEITKVEIPNTIISIGMGAFYNCKALNGIVLPSNLVQIGFGAFQGCEALSAIVLPEGIEEIPGQLFLDCKSLSSVNIPSGVKTIGAWAFGNCDSLDSLFIPASVTGIGYDAFVVSEDRMMTLFAEAEKPGRNWSEEWNFSNNPVVWGATDQNSNVDPTSGLHYAISNIGGETCATIVGINPDSAHFEIPSTLGGVPVKYACLSVARNLTDTLKTIVVPDGVKVLDDFSFRGFTALESVSFGENSLTSVGNGAFLGCSYLASIAIPDGVVSIGDEAFSQCRSLSGFAMPDSVKEIGRALFADNINLTSVRLSHSISVLPDQLFVGCDSLEFVDIPEGVTKIEGRAFDNCDALAFVVIPSTIQTISYPAFYYSFNLNKIYCKCAKEAWERIISIYSKDELDPLSRTAAYFYSESEPSEEGNFWHYVEGVPTAW